MSTNPNEAKKPRYAYSFWRGFYLVCFGGFVTGAGLAALIFIYGIFHERMYWKALVMLFASVIASVGMWGRFRFPPKDPIFERK